MGRRLGVVAVIVALAGAAWWLMVRPSDVASLGGGGVVSPGASLTPPSPVGSSAATSRHAPLGSANGPDAALARSFPTALPPASTLVRQVVAQLRSAAELGHPAAACRLGVELTACLHAREVVKRGWDLDPFAETLALCEGVTDAEIAQAWRFLFNAAQAGNVAAMSKFARDPGLSVDDLAASAEGWAAYRDHAQRFFWGAIQGGDVMALFSNWFALMSGLTVGGKGVIARDPYTALVYGETAMPLLDERRRAMVARVNARLAQELPPSQVVQARTDAERLRARYFSSASPTRDTLEDGYLIVEDCAK